MNRKIFLWLFFVLLVFGAMQLQAQQPTPNKQEEVSTAKNNNQQTNSESAEPYTGDRFIYAYSLSQTETGATGLFTTLDATGLRRKEFRFGSSLTRFHRDPSLRITQLPFSFSYGVRNWLEIFGSFNPYQQLRVGSPERLSGNLLASALAASGGNNNLLGSNSVNQNFFLLPGLSVSGALIGSALPGLAVGQPRLVFDPILNRPKNAFELPKYFNDLPFVARNGEETGDFIVGAKFRLPIQGTIQENGVTYLLSQSSAAAYVKFPTHGTNDLLSNPNNELYNGASSGTTDFGVFFLNSLYLPDCFARKLFDRKVECKVDSSKPIKTTNIHKNFGYIRNGDIASNGVRLINRKDAFVVGLGLDRTFNHYFQTLGEFKWTRYIGGGTPNLRGNSPIDVTAGLRVFPLGLPKGEQLKQNRFFWSIGAGYRYSFNVSEIGGLAKNNHGFVFQVSLGRSNKSDAVDRKPNPAEQCEKIKEAMQDKPLAITQLSTDKQIFGRGEEIRLMASVENNESDYIKYEVKLLPDDISVRAFGVEGLDEYGDNPIIVPIKADFKPGKYRFALVLKLVTENATCIGAIKESNEFEIAGTLAVNLLPEDAGRISANTPQSVSFTASVANANPQQTRYKWEASPSIALNCSETNPVCMVNSTNLQAGETYTLKVTASDNLSSASDTSIVKINNPPKVNLQLSAREIKRGMPLTLTASGSDADGDNLTYSWNVLSSNGQVIKTWQSDNPEQNLDTTTLTEGESYIVQVTVSDTIDEATSDPKPFSVDLPGPQVFFEFDRDRINVSRKQRPIGEEPNQTKLKAVAERLIQQPDLTLFVRVEGNADQIGSVKYNECLGCRRACAVKQALMRLGVKDERQIRIIVSFGEAKAEGKPREIERRKRDRRVDLIFTREGETPNLSGSIVCNCQRTPPGSKCPRR